MCKKEFMAPAMRLLLLPERQQCLAKLYVEQTFAALRCLFILNNWACYLADAASLRLCVSTNAPSSASVATCAEAVQVDPASLLPSFAGGVILILAFHCSAMLQY